MSTFDGYFLAQFGTTIRADRFDGPETAKIHLLSHVHSDHTQGLRSPSWNSPVICSEATRDLLLRLLPACDRPRLEEEPDHKPSYMYRNLRKRRKAADSSGNLHRHICKAVHTDVRHDFSEEYGSKLAITLINANHCPGAVMFLIETPEHAVLYTGDVRCETVLLNQLRANPIVTPFIHSAASGPRQFQNRSLSSIYLDTSNLHCSAQPLSKKNGCYELVQLMKLYPPDTVFFLNCWTTGYEELLRTVAKAFATKIHLDPYKAKIYSRSSIVEFDTRYSSLPQGDFPSLAEIMEENPFKTRFHACERRWMCEACWDGRAGNGCFDEDTDILSGLRRQRMDAFKAADGIMDIYKEGKRPMVVFINPTESLQKDWEVYAKSIRRKIHLAESTPGGKYPGSLNVESARHSTRPELQELVQLFRPLDLYPNTLTSPADYKVLSDTFCHLLHPSSNNVLHEASAAYAANYTTSRPHSNPVYNDAFFNALKSKWTHSYQLYCQEHKRPEVAEELGALLRKAERRARKEIFGWDLDAEDDEFESDADARKFLSGELRLEKGFIWLDYEGSMPDDDLESSPLSPPRRIDKGKQRAVDQDPSSNAVHPRRQKTQLQSAQASSSTNLAPPQAKSASSSTPPLPMARLESNSSVIPPTVPSPPSRLEQRPQSTFPQLMPAISFEASSPPEQKPTLSNLSSQTQLLPSASEFPAPLSASNLGPATRLPNGDFIFYLPTNDGPTDELYPTILNLQELNGFLLCAQLFKKQGFDVSRPQTLFMGTRSSSTVYEASSAAASSSSAPVVVKSSPPAKSPSQLEHNSAESRRSATSTPHSPTRQSQKRTHPPSPLKPSQSSPAVLRTVDGPRPKKLVKRSEIFGPHTLKETERLKRKEEARRFKEQVLISEEWRRRRAVIAEERERDVSMRSE